MGRRIRINGKVEEYEEDKQIQALKREAGFPENDFVVYDTGNETMVLSDKDAVGDIPEDAAVASQPDKGRIFG